MTIAPPSANIHVHLVVAVAWESEQRAQIPSLCIAHSVDSSGRGRKSSSSSPERIVNNVQTRDAGLFIPSDAGHFVAEPVLRRLFIRWLKFPLSVSSTTIFIIFFIMYNPPLLMQIKVRACLY
ncbi:Hypothetical predicted protein [Lecanosticta acicola]|uniref:Uncharacterized protein n=1 Tax=Lecanosticta acicola TaxID=111012 RepID=A0AAI8YZ99_9PEZI|nr:Hypothetical predicted protein [Lecanosticta acicola]